MACQVLCTLAVLRLSTSSQALLLVLRSSVKSGGAYAYAIKSSSILGSDSDVPRRQTRVAGVGVDIESNTEVDIVDADRADERKTFKLSLLDRSRSEKW